MSGLPIAQTQYRASARVWLPVRDHADFENWKRLGVETRQLVKVEDAWPKELTAEQVAEFGRVWNCHGADIIRFYRTFRRIVTAGEKQ